MITTVPATFHFLHPYARHFRDLGWEVHAITGEGPMHDELRDGLSHIDRVPWSRRPMHLGNLAAWRALRRILLDGQYDLLHTHTPVASFVVRLAVASLPRHRRPLVIYTAHGFHFHSRGGRVSNAVWATAERLLSRWTDRLIVINQTDEAAAISRGVISRTRLVRFPGIGIDLAHFHPGQVQGSNEVRAHLGLPDDVVLLSMVAEFSPNKNHVAAIRALQLVPDQRVHLCLAGSGPERERVLALAVDLGVRDRVHPMGSLSDTRAVVLASSATLLPSYREGLSRAVLESLALGVPVIGSRTRGIAELIDTDTGLLIEPDDIHGLARAYEAIQSFPTGGQLRGTTDVRLQQYSLGRIVRMHEELYVELLANRRRSRAAGGGQSVDR
jgi:glycosyltransferase involved in cell wall biosynthesis